jgi:hypothetical protein
VEAYSLETERAKQADRRAALAVNGAKGADSRWHGKSMANAIARPLANASQIDGLAFSSSSSQEDQDQKHRRLSASECAQPVENFKPPEDGTSGQYAALAHEAIRLSLAEDSESLSNITEHFKAICARSGFAYDGITARKAIDAALVRQQRRTVAS